MQSKIEKSSLDPIKTHIIKHLKDKLLGFEHYQNQCKQNVYNPDWIEEGAGFQAYKALADEGNVDAQFNLAFIYREGLYNKSRRNYVKSNHYYEKVAETFLPFLNEDYDVRIDPRYVIGLMRSIAFNGCFLPKFGLKHYQNQRGEGVFDNNWKEDGVSFEQYKRSADKGCLAAQLNLGFIYKTGVCLKHGPKFHESKKYYQLAALQLGVYKNNSFSLRFIPKIIPDVLSLLRLIYTTMQPFKMLTLHKLAADLGDAKALDILIKNHVHEPSIFKSNVEAARYYRMILAYNNTYYYYALSVSKKAVKQRCVASQHFFLTQGETQEKALNYELAKSYYQLSGGIGKTKLNSLNELLGKQLEEWVGKNDIKNANKLLLLNPPIPQNACHLAVQNNNDTLLSLLMRHTENINVLNQQNKTIREVNPMCFYKAWTSLHNYYVAMLFFVGNFDAHFPKELVRHIVLQMGIFSHITGQEFSILTNEAECRVIENTITTLYLSKKTDAAKIMALDDCITKAFLEEETLLETLQQLHYITADYQLDHSAPYVFKQVFNLNKYSLASALINKEIQRLETSTIENNFFVKCFFDNGCAFKTNCLKELLKIIEARPEDLDILMAQWDDKNQSFFASKKLGSNFINHKTREVVAQVKGILGVKGGEFVLNHHL